MTVSTPTRINQQCNVLHEWQAGIPWQSHGPHGPGSCHMGGPDTTHGKQQTQHAAWLHLVYLKGGGDAALLGLQHCQGRCVPAAMTAG